MHDVATTLNKIRAELNTAFLEREDVIWVLLLALLSGEHPILLGDPGVAKSEVVRFLVQAITNKSYWEGQMSKERSDEDVLGPYDLPRLKQGERVRNDKGFLTDVDLALIDEVGKMSAVTGHGLLAALNERLKHEVTEGRSSHSIPLHVAFTTANEIPTHESDDAAALWDRIMLRVFVEDIRKKQNFVKLLTMAIEPPKTRIDFEDIKKASEVDVPAIGVSRSAITQIADLRTRLSAENVNPSPRRWRKAMKILKASAFLAGNDEVYESHLSVLKFVLWDDVEQIETVTRMCESAANPFYDRVQENLKHIGEVVKGLKERQSDPVGLSAYGQDASNKLGKVRASLDEILLEAKGRDVPGFVNAADKHRETLIQTYRQCFDMDADIAAISAEKKLGLGGGSDVSLEVA